MKRLFFYAALALFAGIACNSQENGGRGEFATNSNGLMYNDADMKALRFIVDSLNLKFMTCDLSRQYYSMPQGKLYKATFSSKIYDLKSIINDLDNNGFTELITKYNSLLHSSDSSQTLIIGKDYFLSGTPLKGYDRLYLSDDRKSAPKIITGKWTYRYWPKDTYSSGYTLYCYYFPEDIRSAVIPNEYSKLIQYVDCMVDTSAVIFQPLKRSETDISSYTAIMEKINDYLNTSMKIKNRRENRWEYNMISDNKAEYAIKNLKHDNYFGRLVAELTDECMETGQGTEPIESLIANFVSKEKALLLKRSRRVIGGCSQDQSPRIHALNIATLAAEAHSWDIFLRAHLDIMNDRFERRSDGSYAWGGRKTYLKELEELDLNIVDLMLGLTLRASNVADNHYYGTVWRTGWALAESKQKNLFEEKAIAMMKDNSLDEFNRGLIFLLYTTYTNHLDKKEGKEKRDALRKTAGSFPGFIRKSIEQMKEPAEKESD